MNTTFTVVAELVDGGEWTREFKMDHPAGAEKTACFEVLHMVLQQGLIQPCKDGDGYELTPIERVKKIRVVINKVSTANMLDLSALPPPRKA